MNQLFDLYFNFFGSFGIVAWLLLGVIVGLLISWGIKLVIWAIKQIRG